MNETDNQIINDDGRGIPLFGKKFKGDKNVKLGLSIVLGVALIIIVGGQVVLQMRHSSNGETKEIADARAATITRTLPNPNFIAPPSAEPSTPEEVQAEDKKSPFYIAPPAMPKEEPPKQIYAPAAKSDPPIDPRYKSGMIPRDWQNQRGQDGYMPARQAQNSQGSGSLGGFQSAGGDGIGSQLVPTETAKATAKMLGNRDYLLTKGTMIQCVLTTRIVSTVAGMTKCTLTDNVYSDTGKILLMERGSSVTGEYRTTLVNGGARIFVLWNRVETPEGVVLNLASPGTDPLGGSGLPGYVDNHWGQRLGAAILLSLFEDTTATLSNRFSDNNSNVTLNNSQNNMSDMANQVLRRQMNIPPTFYKNQGDRISIFVARDVDFSGVYEWKQQTLPLATVKISGGR
jgi:type IV secretion system protein VirB10